MLMTRRAVLGAAAAGAALLASGCRDQADQAARLTAILDRVSTEILRESPERCTSLAVSEEQAGGRYVDRLGDASKEGMRRYRGILETALSDLNGVNRERLAPQDAVTLDVVRTSFENTVSNMRFEIGGGAGSPYAVTQLTGVYRNFPDFMATQHPVRTRDEADAYLTRLSGYAGVLDQETSIIAEDAAAGVVPPDFAIDKAVAQLTRFAGMAPAQTVLVTSLAHRLGELSDIAEADKTQMAERAEAIVRDEVFPAYQRQIEALRRVRPQAPHDAGVWRLERGAEMYASSLRQRTTTTLTPDEIHDMGAELVAQFNSEMDAILRA